MSDDNLQRNTYQENVWQTALAGLLHDIGKFALRADVGKREITDHESLGEVKYEHALYSDSFVQEYLPAEWRSRVTAPRRHHNPQSDQDYQVQLADWLSSGEREEGEDNKVPYLLSIFARLAGHNARAYVPLARLNPAQGHIFPTLGEPGGWRREYRDQYKALWDEFTAECKRLPVDSLVTFLESLYGLLQEFTWCIPSAYYGNVPDVSLFDHARTTAALAACLAADGRDGAWCRRVTDDLKAKQGDEEVCLLVGGDLSGVQAFLYTLASAGAARSLRARSFYLQLLTEVVAQYVLDELDLPITNLLYAGGGNFLLLAPVMQDGRLQRSRAEISQKLMAAHDGALHLTLAAVPVQAGEFGYGHFYQVWDRLQQRLAVEKRRPLADLDPAQLAQEIGGPGGEGGSTDRVCNVCGRESKRAIPADKDGVRKCLFCASLEDLGAQLSRATHLVWLKSSPQASISKEPAEWWRTMMTFGVNIYAISANEPPKSTGYIGYWPKQLEIIRVNPLSTGARYATTLQKELGESGAPVVNAYRPFAQLTPFKDRRVMTFDELAQASRGITRWAVLRMDVDNLGDTFRDGFKQGDKNILTLSRVAALSFALRLFFEGWLPRLGERGWRHAQEDDPAGGRIRENTLYVQYAGGDDLFVVGAWDALPEFATRIRESFRAYACNNPAISISAGITLADEKFPLYLAAEQAAEAEHAAKSFIRPDGRGKDAVCFLGQTVGWEQFYAARHRAHLMAGWCDGSEGEPLPKSIIQSFLAIDAEFQRGPVEKGRFPSAGKRRSQFYYGPWVWHAAYRLTRTIAALSRAPHVAGTLKQWEEELLNPDTHLIAIIGLSARWAELLTRKESRR